MDIRDLTIGELMHRGADIRVIFSDFDSGQSAKKYLEKLSSGNEVVNVNNIYQFGIEGTKGLAPFFQLNVHALYESDANE